MAMTADQAARARAGVARVCATASDETSLLNGVSARLRPLLDWDAAAWLTTDPDTVLFTDGRIEGFDTAVCQPWFENELLVDDVNKFADLAARAQAAILSHLPDHQTSARWSEVMRPVGLDAELRATFVDTTGCWGVFEAHRAVDRPDFTPDEANLVVSVSDSIAAGLRRIAVERAALADPRADGPGLLLVQPDGSVVAGTVAGEAWLALLVPGEGQQTNTSLYALAALARGGTDRPRRTRMRAADGRWVTLHASTLVAGEGAAIIVEPAPAHEIAGLLALAYGLSEREREVAMAVARGESTEQIAQGLYISPHTVRDHLKSTFGKVGASSRTELVARLFHDHYADEFFDRVDHEA
jgi:DNA-binding CsgD family transcriptional regulator